MWYGAGARALIWRLAAAAALPLAGGGLAGCGVTGRAAATTSGGVVRVSERDFRIAAPATLRAGDYRLLVHNRGPDAHELIVVRQNGGRLPLRRDGLTVDEDRVEHDEAGALEPGETGAERTLRVHLTPGRYVLLCNMSGHYLGGMRTELVVR